MTPEERRLRRLESQRRYRKKNRAKLNRKNREYAKSRYVKRPRAPRMSEEERKEKARQRAAAWRGSDENMRRQRADQRVWEANHRHEKRRRVFEGRYGDAAEVAMKLLELEREFKRKE